MSETLVELQLFSIMPMNSGKDYKARRVDVAQPLMTSQVGGNQGGDYVVIVPPSGVQISREEQSTFWSEEHLARISQSPDCEREWTERVVSSPSSLLTLLADYGPDGWYGRTSPASCRLMEEGRLEPFSDSWGNSGMGSPTEFLTLNTSEFHSAAVASSLSDILETGDVPQRYFLSATACRGILRRAEKRGKRLPEALRLALTKSATSQMTSSAHCFEVDKAEPVKLSPVPEMLAASM
jgi:hypothetical protein